MTPLDPQTHTPTHTHIHEHTHMFRELLNQTKWIRIVALMLRLPTRCATVSLPLSLPFPLSPSLSVAVRLFFAASSNIYEGDTLFTSIQRCRCLRQWLRQKVVRDEDDETHTETQQEAGQEAGKRACCGRGIAHFYIHTNCQGTYVMPKTDMKILSRAQLPVSHTGSQCEI